MIIYRAMGLINFAQGEFAMFTAFVCWALLQGTDMPYALAVAVAVALGAVAAFAIERLVVRPFEGPDECAQLFCLFLEEYGTFCHMCVLLQHAGNRRTTDAWNRERPSRRWGALFCARIMGFIWPELVRLANFGQLAGIWGNPGCRLLLQLGGYQQRKTKG